MCIKLISNLNYRFDVKNAATAAIINGTIASLIEAGYIPSEDKLRLCVDKYKVRRFKKKIIVKSTKTDVNLEVKGLFLDGRKDNTLFLEKNSTTGRFHQRIRKEYHVLVEATMSKKRASYFFLVKSKNSTDYD